MNIKNWILHPVLFSIYPVLFYYSLNIGQVHPESVFKPLTFTVLLAIGGWCFLRLMLKDWFRSGGIVSLIIILNFSYGHARTNIDFQGVAYFLPAIWIVALLALAFTIIRSGDNFINGTKILNVISAVLCILVATNVVSTQVKMVKEDRQQPHFNNLPQGLIDKDKQQLHPDIYFIILDAYARQDVLKDVYAFDNSKFLDSLESKGFYIADKAISNYGQTGLSVGSSLNLNYLGEWAKKMGENNINRAPLHHIINQNQAQIFFKKTRV